MPARSKLVLTNGLWSGKAVFKSGDAPPGTANRFYGRRRGHDFLYDQASCAERARARFQLISGAE